MAAADEGTLDTTQQSVGRIQHRGIRDVQEQHADVSTRKAVAGAEDTKAEVSRNRLVDALRLRKPARVSAVVDASMMFPRQDKQKTSAEQVKFSYRSPRI